MTPSFRAGAAGLALSIMAVPAASQLRVAKPGDIAGAVATCVAATGPGSVDMARLEADGWARATMSRKDKSVDTPLRIFSSKTGNALIMTTAGTGADGLCVTTARIDALASVSEVERELTTRLGAKAIQRKPGETFLTIGDKLVSLAQSGKGETPAVRISVMQMEKK